MLFLEGQCPHCDEKRGFEVFAVSDYRAKRPVKDIKKDKTYERAWVNDEQCPAAQFFAAGVCIYCDNPILLELEINDIYLEALRECIPSGKRYEGNAPQVKRMWPQPVPPYSHPSLPEKVRTLFVDLQDMLKQNRSPSMIIAGCRAVMESAVKDLKGEGKTLADRVDYLKNKAIVNGVLADWAHHVRLTGNEAIHELEGTQEDAAELVEFTKLFLQYTFEFPSRIQEARNR